MAYCNIDYKQLSPEFKSMLETFEGYQQQVEKARQQLWDIFHKDIEEDIEESPERIFTATTLFLKQTADLFGNVLESMQKQSEIIKDYFKISDMNIDWTKEIIENNKNKKGKQLKTWEKNSFYNFR